MDVPARHQIRDDELVVSWLARIARTGGFFSERHALKALLGSQKVRLHPYLTSHISHIAFITGQEPDSLLQKHTLYPLFWWLGFDRESGLKESMYGNSGSQAVIRAGLPQSKLHFFEGLKFCPICALESRRDYGFSYFKTYHQLPGIEACSDHGCLLHGISGGDYGYDRSLPLPSNDSSIIQSSVFQRRLAEFSKEFLGQASKDCCEFSYQDIYSKGLSRLGYLTECNHIRIRRLTEAVKGYYSDLEFGGELGFPEKLASFEFLGPLLRKKTHFLCHPAKHILFAFWLFEGEQGSGWVEERTKKKTLNQLKLKSNGTTDEDCQTANNAGNDRLLKAERNIKSAIKGNPTWRRKEIKEALGADFFFLYNNAPSLLEEILPVKEPPQHPVKDWDQEDRRIHAAILELENVHELSLSHLDHLVEARGFLRKNLGNLPRTLSLLKRLGVV